MICPAWDSRVVRVLKGDGVYSELRWGDLRPSASPVPPLPLSGCRGARPLDVEMSEVVMRNGNKRIQTQVRLRGDMEGGGHKHQTQVRGRATWSGLTRGWRWGAWKGRGGGLHGAAEQGRPTWDLDAAYHTGTVGSVRGAVKLEGAWRGGLHGMAKEALPTG